MHSAACGCIRAETAVGKDCFVYCIIMQPQDMGWKGTSKMLLLLQLLLLLNFLNHINKLKVI